MVLVDTNVFVSYLLDRHRGRKVEDVVESRLTDTDIELVTPQELIDVIIRVVVEKERLRTHILHETLAGLLTVPR